MTVANWVQNDGGRAAAGFRGTTGDCVCRAIAIATDQPYQLVYDGLNAAAQRERPGAKRRHGRRSHARTGVFKATAAYYIERVLGWEWVACMKIGSGCTVHLKADELPPGRLICVLSRHYTAVINGVVHDTANPTRNGLRCVYGYWKPPVTAG
jgi:hypothetical protein